MSTYDEEDLRTDFELFSDDELLDFCPHDLVKLSDHGKKKFPKFVNATGLVTAVTFRGIKIIHVLWNDEYKDNHDQSDLINLN